MKATKLAIIESQAAPFPRVGAACTTVEGTSYLFSGRGGKAMAPIEEYGGLWRFQPGPPDLWEKLEAQSGAYPAGRSYHCMTSDEEDNLYMHAGCPESGRLSDLWSFNLKNRTWTQLAPAPDPPRGGASIAFCHANQRIYRMNGFDGKSEQGGRLDIYDRVSDSWTTKTFASTSPGPRSVSALLSIRVKNKPKMVTLFGERDPSNLGHDGAGKMLADAWMWDVEREEWEKIESEGHKPRARGWFAADKIQGEHGTDSIVVHGGLDENNERLGDFWRLSFAGSS